jgi:hypothetical protein
MLPRIPIETHKSASGEKAVFIAEVLDDLVVGSEGDTHLWHFQRGVDVIRDQMKPANAMILD